MAKQDDYTRYTIRIPTPLYERVKSAAGEKSINAEIAAALEKAYPAPVLRDGDLSAISIIMQQIEDSATPEEMMERLDALNDFLRDDPQYTHLEVALDQNSGSHRATRWPVVLRLKP